MYLFVSVVGSVLLPTVLFPIALANPLPAETYSEDSLLFSNSYVTGTDTTVDQRPSKALPVNLNTEDWDAANPEPVLLAKGSGRGGSRCKDGFGFACCDQSRYDPYYSNGEEIKVFQILTCGKDETNCPYQLSDVRSCCTEQESEGGGLPKFDADSNRRDGFPYRHKLICAKSE